MSKEQVANLIIPEQDIGGRFLLLHRRHKTTDWWEFPGGKQNFGETSTIAAIREGREELRIETDIVRLLGRVTLPNAKAKQTEYTWWQAEILGGTPAVQEPHLHCEWGYINLGKGGCGALGLSPSVAEFTKRFQNNGSQLETF